MFEQRKTFYKAISYFPCFLSALFFFCFGHTERHHPPNPLNCSYHSLMHTVPTCGEIQSLTGLPGLVTDDKLQLANRYLGEGSGGIIEKQISACANVCTHFTPLMVL